MAQTDYTQQLEALVGAEGVSVDAPLSSYTTFAIGGPASWLVEPASEEALAAVVTFCTQEGLPWRVLGLGSNVLVPDEGIEGVVIRLADRFSTVSVEGERLYAQAGASNKTVARVAQEAALSGYEFASGIPGTIGGAAIMNAGAYDGEFASVAQGVRCLAPDGTVLELSAEQAEWGYRTSRMMKEGLIVLGAWLELQPAESSAIQARMDDLATRRAEKQPLDMPSAGSTFKRPEGYFAGKLIQDAGLQGFAVGGAQVSLKHAGFVVNTGNATAADVLALVEAVRTKVWESTGVMLEPEVRLWS